MKSIVLIFVIAYVFAITNSVTAQNITDGLKTKSGVYMSFADYSANKLALEVDYTNEKHKIKVHDFINKSEIDVIHNDTKNTFKKNDIYGIRDSKGVDYRFYNNLEYKIVQTDTIYIYTKTEEEIITSGKNRRTKQITNYFFSLTGNSEIFALTLDNLKTAFPENHKMHDALDIEFINKSDLQKYDNFHKTYKIIRFLKENL